MFATSDARSPKRSGHVMKVLYIAGSGRVGSTLLGQMLGQIDGFFSVGEAINLWERGLIDRRKCGCGRRVPDCPSWSAILGGAFGSVDAMDARRLAALARERTHPRAFPRLLVGRRTTSLATDEYLLALTSLYASIERETGSRVIVDSSKSPIYAELINRIAASTVYVVHLIRDPRATAYSWLRTKRLPDFGDDRLMAQQSPWTSARRWSTGQVLTELLWRGRAGRYMLLKYEELLTDPKEALRKICALAEEDATELPLAGPTTALLGETHSVSGNPGRFLNGTVELRLDDEWMTTMRARDRRVVAAVTWPLLLRYGYTLNARRERTEQ